MVPSEIRDYVLQKEPPSRAGAEARIERFINANREVCNQFWVEGAKGHLYAGGNQWPSDVEQERSRKARPSLVVDKVSHTIDSLTGQLQTERFQARIAPENYEEPLAGPLDQFCSEQRRRSRGDANLEDAFRDMWAALIGWERITPWQDGPILKERRVVVPLWEMMWDTRARKQNFTDRRGHLHGRWVNAREFRSLFPTKEEADRFFALWEGKGGSGKLNSWPINIDELYVHDEERVFLYTHEWRDTEQAIYLRLPQELDAQVVALIGDAPHEDDAVLSAIAQALVGLGPQLTQVLAGPRAKLGWMLEPADFRVLEERVWRRITQDGVPQQLYVEVPRERYWRANFCGNQLIGKVMPIPEQKFTYIALTDVMIKNPETGHRPRSFVRSMEDQQNALNRALTGMMENAGRSIKDALLVREGFFKNPAVAEEQLSVEGSVIVTQQPMQEGENYKLLQSRLNPVYQEIYQLLQSIYAEEVISPYEQGGVQDLRRTSFKALSSVTQNARGKQGTRFRAYSIALQEEIELQVHQMFAYYSYEEALEIIGPGYSRKDPATGEDVPLLPRDRREWLFALRRQVAIIESPYTATERDELFAKLNETSFFQVLAQYLPPDQALPFLLELMPASLAATAPKALQVLREFIEQQRQQQQAMPPGGGGQTPPQQGMPN